MKLTKKLEAEIKKVMETYWDSYLEGDLKTWASFLPDDYRNIGTNKEEEWNSKKEIVDYTKKVFSKAVGMAELRNKKTNIIPYDPYMMVHELGDLFIKMEDSWTFYAQFRLSSLLEKTKTGWKILHQHGSYPDSKTEKGDAFAFDEIKAENKKLKDAVQRRTIELEEKNRELEIETSLEKVRAVAMSMSKPEHLLNICEVLFKELDKIGFKDIRCALIHIFNDDKGYFDDYDYSDFTGGKISTMPYKGNTVVENFLKRIRKTKEAFAEVVVKGKALADFLSFRKKTGQLQDKRLLKTKEINYYFFSVGLGNIGISNFGKISNDQLLILKRFRNVFQLAYQRYADITLAVAQVREAQIESSLERVRSRSLAMHNTAELQDVIHTVHKEFLNLNIAIEGGSFITINSDIETTLRCWGSGGTADTTEEIHIPLYKKPFCTNLINRIKKGPGFFTEAYTQKEKKDFFTFLFNHEPWKKLKAKEKKEILSSPGGYTRSCYVSQHTSIFIINHLGENFSAADNDILKRFGKVFEQSYTRFLDLQKAEEQAREAEIELALERVRARTMAMQKSEELSETTHLLFEQLKSLGQTAAQLSIGIFKEEKGVFELSATVHGTSLLQTYDVPLNEPFVIKKAVKAWKQKKKTFTIELKGKELTAYNNWRNSVLKKKIVFPEKQWIVNIIFFSKGLLSFSSDKEISKETFQLLERFANVFDGTYTRFLDLQKAETQAKEARIETALERVRAVAMAMKKSGEVINVCEVMYKELQSLGFTNIRNAQIALKNDNRQSYSISVYSDNESVIFGEAHYHSSPIVKDLYRELEQSKDAFYQREFSGKKFNDWRKWREGLSPFADSREASATSMCFYLYSIGIGHIGISTFNAITEIQIEMLKRFKNVFELCYTRYIDVAKAEVQAREAQIELGLERVRARAMAMQHSDELSQLVNTVFKELANLDFTLNWCIINIIDEPSLTNMVWAASPETNKPPESYLMKFEDYPFHHSMMKGYQQRKAKHVYVIEGKEKKEYDEYLFNKTEWKRVPKKAQAASKAMKRYVASFTFSNFGGLQTVGEEPLSEENLDILSRFGKVFDLTYTRFNDLQKAEAQSREAQIELGLERVRARAMAMQNSDELRELVGTVFTELTKLDLSLTRSIIWVFEKATNAASWWMANSEEPSNPMSFYIKYHKHPAYLTFVNEWKKQNVRFVYDLKGRDKIAWDNILFNETELQHLPAVVKNGMMAPARVLLSASFNNFGGINVASLEPLSEEHFDILLRFAKVFDLTYTRFNDLQKAEAQTREAEIELALERVRARTMAMQHSEELLEVATVLFQQVKGLGVPQWNCGFNIWEPGDKAFTYYPGTPDGVISPSPCKIPLHEHPVFRRFDESRKKGVDLLVYEKEGKEQKDHYQYMLSLPGVGDLLQSMLDAGFELPTFQIDHLANFAYGNLIFITYEHFPEMHQVFKRFAKVFEQTYTRFLDLQKSEEQAREATIEMALEKVRSRSMGMQKSEELKEVIQVVYDQFIQLNINIEHTGFIIDYKENEDMHIWLADRNPVPAEVRLPYFDTPHWNSFVDAKKNGKDFFANQFSFEEKNKFYKGLFKLIPGVPKDTIDYYFKADGLAISTVLIDNVGLYIENFKGIPYSDEENKILMRFGKVFQQTYTRFLDLQKAEAQAKEAKIEAALERTRTQSMIMQHSSELDDTLRVFHEQVQWLGIDSEFSYLWLPDEEKDNHLFWATWAEQQNGSTIYKSKALTYDLDRTEPFTAVCIAAWKSDVPVHSYTLLPAEVKNYFAAWKELLEDVENLKAELFHEGLFYVEAFMKYGCFGVMIKNELSEEEKKILGRFSIEFERTYTRFLDLKKAEAQAREAKIEMALEKIRSRTMAMQHSDELIETASLLFQQLISLGIQHHLCGFVLADHQDKSGDVYTASNGSVLPFKAVMRYDIHKGLQKVYDAWKDGKDFYLSDVTGKQLEESNRAIEQYMQQTYGKEMIENMRKFNKKDTQQGLMNRNVVHHAYFSHGWLFVGYHEPITDTTVLKRFASVFDQTYTRFLDLQKAEAQAREAQIEAALERVRSQSMGMQTSKDLSHVTTAMFKQLRMLGGDLFATGIVFCDKHEGHVEQWHSLPDAGMISPFIVPVNLDYIHQYRYDQWKQGTELFSIEIPGDFIEQHFNDIFSLPSAQVVLKEFEANNTPMPATPPWEIDYGASFKHGYILASALQPFAEANILPRFAKVFEQTYIRFLDLQKAEAQAREAKIEMALEKIRSRTMAMQHSDELPEAANLLFLEVQALGIPAWSAGYNILADDKKSSHCIMSSEGEMQIPFKLPLTEHSSLIPWYEAIKNDLPFFVYEQGGEELVEHYRYMATLPELEPTLKQFAEAGIALPTHQINHLVQFPNGFLLFITYEQVPEAHDIFKRFTKVFEQTYTRFLDLKKSEAQTRQAQIEVALERVRARALAMQQPEELKEVAEVLRQEMGLLGVEELETCSIYINDENAEQAECWYALKDLRSEEKKLVNDHFALNLNDTWVGREMLSFYNSEEKQISILMAGANRVEWIRFCEANSAPFRGYYGDEIPDRTYHLYKFSHGAIGAASAGDISKESWGLLRRAASVFSLAYSRFKDLTQARIDLQKLKEEKQRAEDALSNLQAAQKQLVQSEKMASLGELTAGIAHEIQNPLNFVNNFSEVSKELLDEMKEEMDKGNLDDVRDIMKDVIQNLEKINHHGKRADGIVKGMLQHSRSSSATKEPTNINALADEYLRLAYHGLRAKDKSFNAIMKTDFDTSLEKINVIPQDIGRVILNLITNAFYVVNEKKQQLKNGYEPTVTVTSKKVNGYVEISVTDNGNGIPQKVLDKIFQPFFTTKPTGQGTGLGLSLAFDIVTKGHGGELKVETKEGEGTEFIILLPV